MPVIPLLARRLARREPAALPATTAWHGPSTATRRRARAPPTPSSAGASPGPRRRRSRRASRARAPRRGAARTPSGTVTAISRTGRSRQRHRGSGPDGVAGASGRSPVTITRTGPSSHGALPNRSLAQGFTTTTTSASARRSTWSPARHAHGHQHRRPSGRTSGGQPQVQGVVVRAQAPVALRLALEVDAVGVIVLRRHRRELRSAAGGEPEVVRAGGVGHDLREGDLGRVRHEHGARRRAQARARARPRRVEVPPRAVEGEHVDVGALAVDDLLHAQRVARVQGDAPARAGGHEPVDARGRVARRRRPAGRARGVRVGSGGRAASWAIAAATSASSPSGVSGRASISSTTTRCWSLRRRTRSIRRPPEPGAAWPCSARGRRRRRASRRLRRGRRRSAPPRPRSRRRRRPPERCRPSAPRSAGCRPR